MLTWIASPPSHLYEAAATVNRYVPAFCGCSALALAACGIFFCRSSEYDCGRGIVSHAAGAVLRLQRRGGGRGYGAGHEHCGVVAWAAYFAGGISQAFARLRLEDGSDCAGERAGRPDRREGGAGYLEPLVQGA